MAEATETEETGKKKRSKKMLVIPVVVLLLGAGGGGYFMMNGKSKASASTATTTTTIPLGKIVRLDAITLNLNDGHVLKVGLALQTVAKPKDKDLAAALAGGKGEGASSSSSDTSSPLGGQEAKALDEAISVLGGSSFNDLSTPTGRAKAKDDLTAKIKQTYDGDVTDVYFTDFVMS
jgi:flagellar protein FliL